eukprot:6059263-Pyramimonas_sp.AAC.1
MRASRPSCLRLPSIQKGVSTNGVKSGDDVDRPTPFPLASSSVCRAVARWGQPATGVAGE